MPNFLFNALCPQALAEMGCAPVLPDDGAVNRLAGCPIPEHDRFTLVRDADSGEVRCLEACLSDGLLRHLEEVDQISKDRAPPSPARVMLRELGLRDGDRAVGLENNGREPKCLGRGPEWAWS